MSRKKVILGLAVTALAVFSAYFLTRAARTENGALTPAIVESSALAGSWSDWAGTEFRFENGSWESWFLGSFGSRGTYTAGDGTIVMELADIHVGNEWISYEQEPQTGTYHVSGDILALTFGDETRTFTRQ